jgi:hypothetical protein
MFGWLFGRRRVPARPRLVLELLDDDSVTVTADWPAPRSAEEATGMGRGLAAAAFALHSGRLLPLIQRAFVQAGRLKGDEAMADHLLNCLNHMGGTREEGPVVPPDEVFTAERGERS